MTSTKLMESFIRILYSNDNIRHGELAEKLHTSPSSLTGCVSRYLTIEPPLFYKIKKGKYCEYRLTKEGKDFGQQIIEKDLKKDLKDNNPDTNTSSLTETLISFVLEHTPENENILVQCLKKIDVSTISSTLSFREFMFLSLSLGMITDREFSYKNALDQTYPSEDINNQLEWGSMVYRKCKDMIQTELSQNTDYMIQNLNDEVSKPGKAKK